MLYHGFRDYRLWIASLIVLRSVVMQYITVEMCIGGGMEKVSSLHGSLFTLQSQDLSNLLPLSSRMRAHSAMKSSVY
jgi:hypothetical protein